MKSTLLSLLFVLLCTTSTFAQQPAMPAPLVDELMGRFATAWNTDDADALRSLLADDVVLLGSNQAGAAAVIDGWARQQMAAQDDPLVIAPLHSAIHGNMAHQMGLWRIGAVEGIHTFIWNRGGDGAWRIAKIFIQNQPGE